IRRRARLRQPTRTPPWRRGGPPSRRSTSTNCGRQYSAYEAPEPFPAVRDGHRPRDGRALLKRERTAFHPDLPLSDGLEDRRHRRLALDQGEGRPELPDHVAVGGAHERQAGLLRQADRRAVEIDSPGVEVAELDRLEQVDLLEQSTAER